MSSGCLPAAGLLAAARQPSAPSCLCLSLACETRFARRSGQSGAYRAAARCLFATQGLRFRPPRSCGDLHGKRNLGASVPTLATWAMQPTSLARILSLRVSKRNHCEDEKTSSERELAVLKFSLAAKAVVSLKNGSSPPKRIDERVRRIYNTALRFDTFKEKLHVRNR